MSGRRHFGQSLLLALLSAVLSTATALGENASVPLADGFDLPVGSRADKGKVYHKARGFVPNGHLGEDWDGAGGGDTDLGDPVYAIGNGIVLFARDYRVGWGNVVIIRHAYAEEGVIRYIDSLYGHLDKIMIAEGAIIKRGQQIGTIGNNYGMYDAHLHFEIRKNLAIGMNRSAFARDLTCYFDPTTFVERHRQLERGGELAAVPVNTFTAGPAASSELVEGRATVNTGGRLVLPVPSSNPPGYSGSAYPGSSAAGAPRSAGTPTKNPRGPFFVDRYSDMRK